ncbi:hypothetical protein GWK47_032059 [Chionoecetes opilio]|uniref:Uncharacterized protein n=1 Tax=Chionoecetes opilio TaxID=41210 RepID=A0A8J4YJ22_CHIOP|nr:hypothetical protein GWK47_032059 [Chionoecetes opilio]
MGLTTVTALRWNHHTLLNLRSTILTAVLATTKTTHCVISTTPSLMVIPTAIEAHRRQLHIFSHSPPSIPWHPDAIWNHTRHKCHNTCLLLLVNHVTLGPNNINVTGQQSQIGLMCSVPSGTL